MSNVNEPEGALKLASTLVRDLIGVEDQARSQMQDMAALLGMTVALVELLDETGDGEVVMTGPDGPVSVADHVESLRTTLLSLREMDAAVDEVLGNARMLYDRFLEKYTKDSD